MSEITLSLVNEGLKKGKIEKLKGEIDYYRFKEGFRGVERGTVIIAKKVLFPYPHIKRIFTLENGLKRNMGGATIYAEEKIDGFNVRLLYADKKIFAFSRGGFLDSFVTEKAREMGFGPFFRDYPDAIICAEMIGNTPYTAPEKDFDVRLFVFDIDEGDGHYLTCPERHALVKKYKLSGVPFLGKFESDDYKGLGKLILTLNKSKKEGMVLKSENREKAVKYVTPWSDIEDISRNSRLLFDMPIGFYYQRILRSAFFISDFGLDRDEYAKKLGTALYEGLITAINESKKGGDIDEEFEILIGDGTVWEDIRRHMSREVKVEVLWKRDDGKKTRIRFRKAYKRTSKTLSSYAGGRGVED